MKIRDFSAGSHHAAMVDELGRVFTWGAGSYGRWAESFVLVCYLGWKRLYINWSVSEQLKICFVGRGWTTRWTLTCQLGYLRLTIQGERLSKQLSIDIFYWCSVCTSPKQWLIVDVRSVQCGHMITILTGKTPGSTYMAGVVDNIRKEANMTPKQFFETGDAEMKDVAFWKKGFSAVGEDGKVRVLPASKSAWFFNSAPRLWLPIMAPVMERSETANASALRWQSWNIYIAPILFASESTWIVSSTASREFQRRWRSLSLPTCWW